MSISKAYQNPKAIYRFLPEAIIYYTQNVDVLAGSPGYLNLMTTQERLATLLVRVSYPGDSLPFLKKNYCKILDRTRRRDPALPISCTTRNLTSHRTLPLKKSPGSVDLR